MDARAQLEQPSRQSPVAVLFILIRYLRKMVRALFALVLVLVFQQGDKTIGYILGVLLVILAVQLVYSLLAYLRYTFFVEGDELIIESGVLGRKRTGIPFDRIQTVSFEQNVLHQILNVVQLNIDTAGSAKAELNIDALARPVAEHLRNFILTQKAAIQAETMPLIEGESEDGPGAATSPAETEVMRLSLRELILIGITENHLRTAGILLSTAFGLYQLIEGETADAMERLFGQMYDFVLDSSLLLVLSLGALLLFASFFVSMGRTVLQYFDLRLWRTEKGFRLHAGLFNRREQAASRSKIQLVRWSTNPLRQWMGLYSVRLFQASSQEVKSKQAITIPGCREDEAQKIVSEIVPPSERENYSQHPISPLIISRQVLYFGIIPALILGSWTFLHYEWLALLWLLWLPLCYALSRRFQRRFQWHVNDETLLVRRGVIATHFSLLSWYKVQAITIKQSPYQKRKSLASIVLYTAAGDQSIPYVPLAQAQALRDFVLYRCETDEREWM